MRTVLFLFLIVCAQLFLSQNCLAQTEQAQRQITSASDREILAESEEIWALAARGGEGQGAARKRLAILIEKNPDSNTIPILNALMENLNERRAGQLLSIALFYLGREHGQKAAESRLREITEQFPEYSRLDEVLYQLALLQAQLERASEARETANELLSKFGSSPRAKDAHSLVERLGTAP